MAKKTILIIDDEPLISNAARDFLVTKGFEVLQAFDGESGLEMVKKNLPDLILLDIIMPKKDGFTVAKDLKFDEKTKDIPIIVYSAKEGMKDLFAIEGIENYLIKPINNDDLLSCVNKLIGTDG